MLKYIRLILILGTYLVWTYPRMRYNAKHVKDIPYAKRFELHQKIIKRGYKAARCDVTVIGEENLPQEDGLVFCPNHQSYVDPSFIAHTKHNVIPIAKIEIARMPFIGDFAKALDAIFLERDNLRQSYQVSRQVYHSLIEKKNVLIYLEGTRSKHADHHMNEFKAAGLKPVMEAKATIVPTVLWGYYAILDIKNKQKYNPVSIQFLKPIRYEDYQNMTHVELAQMIHDEINLIVLKHIQEEQSKSS